MGKEKQIGVSLRENIFFDYEDGSFGMSLSGNMLIDSDGDLMMKMSDNMAMDMDSGELHLISSFGEDDD